MHSRKINALCEVSVRVGLQPTIAHKGFSLSLCGVKRERLVFGLWSDAGTAPKPHFLALL